MNLIWEITEACVGIICACLPVMGRYLQVLTSFDMTSLRSLLRRYIPTGTGSDQDTSRRNGHSEEELGEAPVVMQRLGSRSTEDMIDGKKVWSHT